MQSAIGLRGLLGLSLLLGGCGAGRGAVAVRPAAAVVLIGDTLQLEAEVDGRAAAARWTVEGAGTISATGLYEAPNELPDSTTVVITAHAGGRTGSARLTLVSD